MREMIKNFLFEPYRMMNWQRCLLAFLGAALGMSILLPLLLRFPLFQTRPVELLGCFAYVWDEIAISNRLHSVALVMVGGIIMFHLLVWAFSRIEAAREASAWRICAVSLVPALVQLFFVGFRVQGVFDQDWLCISELLFVGGLWFSIREAAEPERAGAAALSTGALFFSFYIPAGIYIALRPFLFVRLPDRWFSVLSGWTDFLSVLVWVLPVLVAVAASLLPDRRKLIRFVLCPVQLLMLFFFFSVLPEIYRIDGKCATLYGMARPFWVLVLPLSLVGAFDVLRRARGKFTGSPVSPFPVLALLVAHFFRQFTITGLGNLYEYGNRISAYDAIRSGELTFFKDVSICYGLWDYIVLRANEFFTGTLTMADTCGESFVALLVLIFSFLVFRAALPLGFAVALSFLIGGWTPGFVAAFLLWWLNPRLLRKPARWTAVWLLGCAVVPFLRIPQGAMLVVATVPVFARQLFLLYRDDRKNFRGIGLLIAGLCFLFFVWPFQAYFFGLVRIFHETGGINAPWAASPWDTGNGMIMTMVLGNLLPVMPLLGAVLAVLILTRPEEKQRELKSTAALAGFGALFLYPLISISYSYSRIDGDIARQYQSFAALVPVAVLLAVRYVGEPMVKRVVVCGLLGAMLYVGILKDAAPPCSPDRILHGGIAEVPADQLVDGAAYRLPKAGRSYAAPGAAAELSAELSAESELKQVLDRVLSPGESFLNLSLYGGLYFVFDRKMPAEHNCYYTVTGDRTQFHMLEQLKKRGVKVTVFGRDVYDHSYPMFRTHYLYRFALDNGLPCAVNDRYFVVMPPEDFAKLGVPPPDAAESAAVFERYYPPDRERYSANNFICSAPVWGRGFDRFVRDFTDPLELGAGTAKEENSVTFDFDRPVDGRRRGLLAIKVESPCWAGACWDNDIPNNRQYRIYFRLEKGMNLVPLDSFPRWLLAAHNRSLTIFSQDRPLKLRKVTLYQRKMPNGWGHKEN